MNISWDAIIAHLIGLLLSWNSLCHTLVIVGWSQAVIRKAIKRHLPFNSPPLTTLQLWQYNLITVGGHLLLINERATAPWIMPLNIKAWLV